MVHKIYRYFGLAVVCLLAGANLSKTSFAEEAKYTRITGIFDGYEDSQGLAYRFGTGYEDIEDLDETNPYHMKEGELRVYGTHEVKENVIIPDEVDGHKVVGIALYGFENCSQIKSVQFGKNIRTIEGAAFRNCSQLESVQLENDIQTIAEEAFQNCTRLQSVRFGKNIQIIEARAFKNCTNLTKVTFQKGAGLCEWGADTFVGTSLCNKAREKGKALILNRALVDLNKIRIKIPKISVAGNTLFGGKTIGFDIKHIQTFKEGGFPEDGWFRANHGEIMGKFDNGKSAVANNKQITEGISLAVQAGNKENNSLIRQEISVLQKQNDILMGILQKEIGITPNDIFGAVRQEGKKFKKRTGQSAFV